MAGGAGEKGVAASVHRVFFGVMKMSWIERVLIHNTVNRLNAAELFTLQRVILRFVNFT